jgi:hypothetical protein
MVKSWCQGVTGPQNENGGIENEKKKDSWFDVGLGYRIDSDYLSSCREIC